MKSIFILLGVLSMAVILPSKKDMALVKDNLYFDKREVSNAEWKAFETELIAQGQTIEAYRLNDVWGVPSMDQNYAAHAAYDNYPAIGVTKQGATAYCQWRNQKSEVQGLFRLPTKAEFTHAMQAGESSEKWEKAVAKAQKRYGKDEPLYNYHIDKGQNQHLTAPTSAYLPNGFGIYNLKGNVAEMVLEENTAIGGSWKDEFVAGWESEKTFEGPNAWVGFRCVCELN